MRLHVSARRDRRRRPALLFTLAFVGATCVPVYAVFLAPEILHFAMIFFAYFLWLYKEVKPDAPAWLRGRGSDIAAAILLGAATYSKPPNHALLVAPLVLWFWWRRKWLDGLLAGAVSVAVACAFFGLTAMNAGEFNYQGGDRKTFYTAFPFDGSTDSVWDRKGTEMSTNDSDSDSVLPGLLQPLRAQRRVLPGRPAFRLRAVFLSGRGRDRLVAVLQPSGAGRGGC